MEGGLLLKRLVKFMECRQTQFADGQMMVLLSLRELQGVHAVILFLKKALVFLKKNQEQIIFTLESLLQNKEKTWIDKKPFFGISIQNHKVIRDIGSGLNYKRKGLLKLLRESNKNQVREIVVFSKDRLCRFGFELLQFQFSENNTNLVVYEQVDKTPETEFSEDILAILQVFACRWNGKRKYKINKNTEIQIETKQSSEDTIEQTQEQLQVSLQ